MQKLTEEQIERVVANVAANLAFEGMSCTVEDKAAIRRIASGQTTAAEECAAIVAKYKKLTEDVADLAIYEDAHAEYVRSGRKSSLIDELWKELNLDEDAAHFADRADRDRKKDIRCFYDQGGVCQRDGSSGTIVEGQCESCSDFCVKSWRWDQIVADTDRILEQFADDSKRMADHEGEDAVNLATYECSHPVGGARNA